MIINEGWLLSVVSNGHVDIRNRKDAWFYMFYSLNCECGKEMIVA